MNHNDAIELLGAFALDAVSSDEMGPLSDHVAICSDCRAELDEFRSMAAIIAGSGEEAPSSTWDAIARTLTSPDTEPTIVPFWRRRSTLMVVTAVAALAALVVGSAYVVELGVSSGLRTEIAAARESAVDAEGRLAVLESENAIARAVEQASAELSTISVNLGAESSSETMTIVLTESGVGYVATTTLPMLPADRTYQLWAVVDSKVISAAVLGNDPAIVPFRIDPQGLEALAITEEESGGVVVSANPVLVAWSR